MIRIKGGWPVTVILVAVVIGACGCPKKKPPEYTIEPAPAPLVPPRVAVRFSDPALEAVVREAVGAPEGEFFEDQVNTLTVLKARQKSITDLAGIEHLSGLQALDLGQNYLRDITPLAKLTDLTELKLDDNFIADLSALAGLANLAKLDLGLNEITDLGPLAGLANLTTLSIEDNEVTSIAPLANLSKLNAVNIKQNRINDLMPLWDISEKGGFGEGGVVMVAQNPISAPGRDILNRLKAKGVKVEK